MTKHNSNYVRIVSGLTGKEEGSGIWIDGNEVKGARKVTLAVEAGKLTRVNVEFVTDQTVEVEAHAIVEEQNPPTLQEISGRFKKRKRAEEQEPQTQYEKQTTPEVSQQISEILAHEPPDKE